MGEHTLDRDWTTPALLRFALPTAVMMLSMGLYTAADTVFVARLVNADALSALNIVCPVINLTVGLGTMLAAGGNAVISRKLGAGSLREAGEDLTSLVLTGLFMGFLLLAAGLLRLDELIRVLGASERLFPYCRAYLGTLLLFLPANVLQTLFSNFLITAGRPGLGFGLSLAAGGLNLILDYLLMGPGGLGVRGAALGTGIGYLVPAAAGGLYFARSRAPVSFTKPRPRPAVLLESCLNGSSELVSQLAAAVTTFLFNSAMMDLRGEEGVAAITILIYAQFLLNTLYIGFSMGAAPVIGFLHGSGDHLRQKKVFRLCIRFIAAASLAVFLFARAGGPAVVRLFAKGVPPVEHLAAEGFRIFSWSFLFCGLNIFTSALLTALSKGAASAALSSLRTFGLLAGGLLVLPRLWGVTGVWLAVPAAEALSSLVAAALLVRYRACYGYDSRRG